MTTLGFFGGTGSVTGANFLLDTGGAKVLIDCGLIQGERFAVQANCEAFAYEAKEIDVLLVTHAHADHIGRIPKLIADGFTGRIISTEPTKELAAVMLPDAFAVMEHEVQQHGVRPCYDRRDVDAAMAKWEGVTYKERVELPDGVQATFRNAGHILGSAHIVVERNGRSIVFSGDIGNVPQPLLDAPDIPTGYDYLVMESVYGDRSHEEVKERNDLLKRAIIDTQRTQGTLIIPAFSLERTQGMLYEINNFVESGEIEPLPVFLDSPLAIAVTDIYRRRIEYLKKDVQEEIRNGDDIFDFEGLSFTKTVKESAEIHSERGAKIIIAGSGMSHGGRIRRHEQRYLEESNTTLLLVGYQAVGSLGRLLSDGAKRVKIDGKDVRVRARVAHIRGYSGHADRDQLVDFVAEGGGKVSQVFVTMGEERAALFLVQRLRDYLGVNAVAPELGEQVTIDL